MKEGDITEPIKDQAGRWHLFKVTGKRTEAKDLTLNDPEVKKQISDAIRDQRKQLVNSALLMRAMNEAKIENYLAQRVLENPNVLGVLRPVTPATSASPSSPSAAASPAK
jgi:parvulin-like peptidyl-prolyl isomerase